METSVVEGSQIKVILDKLEKRSMALDIIAKELIALMTQYKSMGVSLSKLLTELEDIQANK